MTHFLPGSYTPFDPKEPHAQSSFSCAFTDDFSLESLILHSRTNGCAMDSSYRNKNENRAPMTLLITVNAHQHMLPGK